MAQGVSASLHTLESLRGADGNFTFRLRWGKYSTAMETTVWRQSSNPTNVSVVTGYNAVEVPTWQAAAGFAGLKPGAPDSLLAGGSQSASRSGFWVGALHAGPSLHSAMWPGPRGEVDFVELSVLPSPAARGGGTSETITCKLPALQSQPVIASYGSGVACADSRANGIQGYLMYSRESIHTRWKFWSSTQNSNFVCVHYKDGWQYHNNDELRPFSPLPGDRLVASVTFPASATSAVTLRNASLSAGTVHGIALGYHTGSLAVVPNRWDRHNNGGEFTVSGTFTLQSSLLDVSISGGHRARCNVAGGCLLPYSASSTPRVLQLGVERSGGALSRWAVMANETLVLRGTGFASSGVKVSLGGAPCAVSSANATEIRCMPPRRAGGYVRVEVFVPGRGFAALPAGAEVLGMRTGVDSITQAAGSLLGPSSQNPIFVRPGLCGAHS